MTRELVRTDTVRICINSCCRNHTE